MDIKVALVLHGKVGGKTGKHKDNAQSSKDVLEIAHKHNKGHIIDTFDADTFLHSWSTELENEIVELYQPKEYLIEPQIQFEIPDWIKAEKTRAFAHLSRWSSFNRALATVLMHNIKTNAQYTHILIQRFDLCWNITPNFEEMDPNYFWVGKSTLDTNKEWSDRWFCSSPSKMFLFGNLESKLEEYMTGELPSTKQYGGISSHQLSKFHAEKLNLNAKFKYNFGGYGQQPNHYNEVRRQYFGDDK